MLRLEMKSGEARMIGDPNITHAQVREWAEQALVHARTVRADMDARSIRNPEDFGCVNWESLRVVEVLKCIDEHGLLIWQVLIEEADSNELSMFVYEWVKHNHGLALDVKVEW